jgi:microsomal dipeptidase-like Zn-dependent dipeptidase
VASREATMKSLMILIFIFTTALSISTSSMANPVSIDLHSHAFMKEGMGLFFRGEFNGPLKAKNWKQMLASKLNAETLNQSDIRLFVVAMYAHPVLAISPKRGRNGVRNSIRRQVALARRFVEEHPNWILATSSRQARSALALGKRVMVLSVEGAHSLLETEKDLDEFIDRLGISIVTPLHLINTKFGGAAYMRGLRKTLFTTKHFTCRYLNGIKINPKGLTEKGRWLINQLIKRKVWIDLTHSSDMTVKDILPMINKVGQPILFTHTGLRRHYKAERGLADWQIDEIKVHGGFVGLVPSEEMMVDTKIAPEACPSWCKKCKGGIPAFVTHYNELSREIGIQNVALGSDFNGGIPHLAPQKECDMRSGLDQRGLWNISQVYKLWDAMLISGAMKPRSDDIVLESFLNAWAKVR